MTGTFPIAFRCPPMRITPINGRLRRTAAEPMTFTLTMPNGSLTIFDVTIPETDVNAVHWPRHWLVDDCSASATDAEGNSVQCDLPPEPVTVYLLRGYSIAHEMEATVRVVLADGSVGIGTAIFPDCKTPLSTGIAEGLTATGEVTFP